MKKLFLFVLPLAVITAISACKKINTPPVVSNANSEVGILDPSIFDFWLQVAGLKKADGRVHAFGFSIGSKGYIGGGERQIRSLNDFWEYDPAKNIWTQKANLGGFSRESAASFVIGNKGYICTGFHRYLGDPADTAQSSRLLADTWQYDPDKNTWTKKASFPGLARWGAVGVAINGMGYVGTGTIGSQGVDGFFNDWYQYDALKDTWSKKADFPGVARCDAAAVAIGRFAYLGTGGRNLSYYPFYYDSKGNYSSDWWQYNPASNTWLQKTSFPGMTRSGAVALAVSGKAFIVSGKNCLISPTSCRDGLNDALQYDPVTNAWTTRASMQYARSDAAGFTIDNSIYVGTGNGSWSWGDDLWQYTP